MKLFRRLVRYTAVSAISSALSLTVLGILVFTGATTAGWANVIATAVGIGPSFELNRRWVWGRTGSRSLLSEVGPFAGLSFVALALSTVAVSLAAGWAASAGLGPGARALAAEAASIATFGTVWVVQYVLLDRVLFAPDRGARQPSAVTPSPTPSPGGAARAGAGAAPSARDRDWPSAA